MIWEFSRVPRSARRRRHDWLRFSLVRVIRMNVDSNSISELFDSVEKLRKSPGILHNLGTAVVICNEHLKVVLLNPSAQSLLDVSENQALGESILTYFEHDDTEKFLN